MVLLKRTLWLVKKKPLNHPEGGLTSERLLKLLQTGNFKVQQIYILYMLLYKNHPVILFDGVCNLCSGSVKFVIKHDRKKQFRFASLQSAFGQKVLQNFGLPANELNSFILLEDENVYTKSTGALRITKRLNGLWPLLYGFIIVPAFIRNAVYSFIARNRYKWFGKKDACWLPTAELRNLFLDDMPVT